MVRLLGELACGPHTGLEEIDGNLPQEDFWPVSLRVRPRHNFLFARYPDTITIARGRFHKFKTRMEVPAEAGDHDFGGPPAQLESPLEPIVGSSAPSPGATTRLCNSSECQP
jgi:hypothetical protein